MKALTIDMIRKKTKSKSINKLTELSLWGMGLSDVSLLKEMPQLQLLSLSGNSISSLEPFKGLSNLKELYLRSNNVSNASELVYLVNITNLKVLWLSENPIAFTPYYRELIIRFLPTLERLDDKYITEKERQYAFSLNLNHFPILPGQGDTTSILYEPSPLNEINTISNKLDYHDFEQVSNYTLVNSNYINTLPKPTEINLNNKTVNSDTTNKNDAIQSNNIIIPRDETVNTLFPNTYVPRLRQDKFHYNYKNSASNLKGKESMKEIEARIKLYVKIDEISRKKKIYKTNNNSKKSLQNIENNTFNGQKGMNEPENVKNNNTLTAILVLLNNLDDIELKMVMSECKNKLKLNDNQA